MAGEIPLFKGGNPEFVAHLNMLVRAINRANAVSGDNYIAVTKGQDSLKIGLNVAALRPVMKSLPDVPDRTKDHVLCWDASAGEMAWVEITEACP